MKKKQVSPAVTPKRGRPRKNTLTPVNKKPSVAGRAKAYRESLEKENFELQRLALYWKDAYTKLEAEYRGKDAVIRYLETKIAQLISK